MDGSASGGAATRRSPSGLRRSRACRSTAAATRRLPARGAYGDHSLQELPDSSRLAGAAIGRLEAQGVGRLTARVTRRATVRLPSDRDPSDASASRPVRDRAGEEVDRLAEPRALTLDTNARG